MAKPPRLRFMLHIFSCEGYSRAEVHFSCIVSLISSMVQDMLQWGWNLEGPRVQLTVINIEPVPGILLK